MKLLEHELQLYNRHILLPEIGESGQLKLKFSKVLVVGVGGLGCSILQYLAAAGIGQIGIVDHDVISVSNLQRQILFKWNQVGMPKVDVAAKHLRELNPFIDIKPFFCKIDSSNILDLAKDYDIIVDATDNFSTKYILNDGCYFLKKPFAYASLNQFEAHVAIFNVTNSHTNEMSPNYRDLFPEPPPPNLRQNCSEGGVLGVLAGLVGCLQANEVIKLIAGIGEPLVGKLLFLNSLNLQINIFTIRKNKNNPLSGEKPTISKITNVDSVCSITNAGNTISANELKEILSSGQEVQLIDVREAHESEKISLGGILIPLNSLSKSLYLIKKDKPTIFYCKSGMRSQQAVSIVSAFIQECYSLKGGLDEYLISEAQKEEKFDEAY